MPLIQLALENRTVIEFSQTLLPFPRRDNPGLQTTYAVENSMSDSFFCSRGKL
jgi:hypothetical protein